ncbi:deaminase domain-containing protein [Pseudomonas faucium]|uniref:deaminase domain-containing protein n=1 Tax=Pseudomonas faucium TaxID=2740518 RepID=UPI001F2E8CA2|nr:deaminase domain-containing protein [Pseudomonas faucium]
MSPETPNDDLPALIGALDTQSLVLHSELSGPHDLKTSLNLHLDRAFDFPALYPSDLDDQAIRASFALAFASPGPKAYVNAALQRSAQAPVSDSQCAHFYTTLAEKLLTAANPLARWAPTAAPYSISSLAQSLWADQQCLVRRDAFIVAALLAYAELPTHPTPPRPASPALQLEGYLDLPAIAQHLLSPAPGTSLARKLFATLQTDVHANSRRYRAPTAKERKAGHLPNEYGKAWLPGPSLQGSPAQVLDALLHSSAFDDWALSLGATLQWPAHGTPEPRHLALAEQALLEVIYPPQTRRPGYLLDFDLFSQDNASTPAADIRHDLVNSVQASLACTTADAQLASELLMRRLAPELLLEDWPADYRHEPDLLWTQLRQGAWVLLASGDPLTFNQALAAGTRPSEADDPLTNEALHDTLVEWAQVNQHIDHPAPWSAAQWRRIHDHYLTAWDLDALRALPDRVAQARWQLEQAGLDPDGRNSDQQLHLEAYLDHGENYVQRSLPDMNTWYESAFDAWQKKATAAYEKTFQCCLSQLDPELMQRLHDEPWTCHAVAWPRYCGPVQGGIPGYGDSAETEWRFEVATKGLLILLPGTLSDTLLTLFPEQLQWTTREVDTRYRHRLTDTLELNYSQFHDTPLPWDVANFPRLQSPLQAPAEQRVAALARHYAEAVALSDRQALHAVGKGATRLELHHARQQQESLGRYLWKLLKNNVPGLGCFDVRSGQQALACGLDALFLLGSAIRVGGRLLRPLVTLHGAEQQAANASREGIVNIARRWSGSLPEALLERAPGPRRWHSAPELPSSRRWFDEMAIHEQIVPGQTPPTISVSSASDDGNRLVWAGIEEPVSIHRSADKIDALINGCVYRLHPISQPGVANRLSHASLVTAPAPTIETISPNRHRLIFKPPAIESNTPVFGQQVSRAFLTRRIEPFVVRVRGNDNRSYWSSLIVRDGKILHLSRGRVLTQVTTGEAAINYLLADSKPSYHRRIMVEPSGDFWFGLPGDMPLDQVTLIASHCPPIRLGGLARGIADRRTLRGAVIEWRGEQWLMVEADTLAIYGAPYQPWKWQSNQLKAMAAGSPRSDLATAPHSERRRLQRITDQDAIESYLEVSESYRIVATHANLQQDIDNVAQLLRDWIRYDNTLEPLNKSPYIKLLEDLQEQSLTEYAQNILTRLQPQRALTGLTGLQRSGVVGLNKHIIPNWWQLAEVDEVLGQHIVGVLNRLLPAHGGKTAFTSTTLAELLTDLGARTLREHLGGANLAFALVQMHDGTRRVYYSLSGGRRHLLTIPLPSPNEQPPVTFIDARAYMNDRAPDLRFSQLPVLRRSDQLVERSHRRTLDSERLIASTLNAQLLTRSEQVEYIHVFTLLDTCRSCGGYVLPRLRLDYPRADFGVTWLLPYAD